MDQATHLMDARFPAPAVQGVYRLLLADEIAVALTSGNSVVATGTHDTSEILDLTAAALIEAGVRVLEFRPPLDSASFISQFASQWRGTSKSPRDLLPQASGERFVMLFHDAHTIAPETLQRLERMTQVWPGMQMAFAGLPSLITTLQTDDHPAIKRRVTLFTKIAVSEEPRDPPLEEAFATVTPPLTERPPVTLEPEQPTPTFTIPSHQPTIRPKPPRKTLRWLAAFAIMIAAAALAAGTATRPTLQDWKPQDWATTAQTYVANLMPKAHPPPNTRPPPPDPDPAPHTVTQVTPPSPPAVAPAPPALWTAMSTTAPAPAQNDNPAPSQLTFIAKDRATVPKPDPEPTPEPRIEVARPAPPTSPRSIPANATPLQETARPLAPSGTGPGISAELAEAMTRRGLAMLEWGDVSAARLLLARATTAGSGAAALAMGTTFDAATLDRIGAVGIVPDPIQAAAWYRVALLLGDGRAQAMLDNAPTSLATAKPKDTP